MSPQSFLLSGLVVHQHKSSIKEREREREREREGGKEKVSILIGRVFCVEVPWHTHVFKQKHGLMIFCQFSPSEGKAKYCVTKGQFHQHFMHCFYMSRSQKCKKTDSSTVSFAILGSGCAKSVHRTLMKLTPGLFVCLCL